MIFDRFEKTAKDTLILNAMTWLKIPLLALCRPKIVERSTSRCVVRIRRNYWTQNHVGSMYFGALSMGAELSIAASVVFQIQYDKIPLNFLFTDFEAKFLKKGTGDVYFIFEEMEELQKLVQHCIETGEKSEHKFRGRATLSLDPQAEPIMTYALTLNLKRTKKHSGKTEHN
jgi:hypothetical protein